MPVGQDVLADIKRPRNAKFHRKFFALINHAYECWEPVIGPNDHGPVEKSRDRFRADLIILAGFYEQVIRLDGSIRIEPKSISFASMDEDQFAELYNKVIDVILQKILTEYTREDLNRVVEETLRFA